MPQRYRRKSPIVEAERWEGDNLEAVSKFVGAECFWSADEQKLYFEHALGPLPVPVGYYVVRHPDGDVYIVAPVHFEATHEVTE